MRIISPSVARRQSGLALIIIMMFLGVSLIVFASIMYWISSNAKITLRNNLYNQTQAAAESATENALASMMRDFSFQNLQAASSYTTPPSQTNWAIPFQFSDLNHNSNQISVSIGLSAWQVLDSQYYGLAGYVNNCTNTAVATPLNQGQTMSAAVQQVIQLANVPLFQFAIFYNMDMELNPGASMTVNGRVHSNNNIWTTGAGSGGSTLNYSSSVDASGAVTLKRNPLDNQGTRTGNVVFADPNAPITNSDSLTMPLGVTNTPDIVRSILGPPPSALTVPTPAAYYPTGQVYLYNGADVIISNSTSGKLSLYYDDQFNATPLTPIPPDSGANYSFVTNVSFYDYREGKTVSAVQVDVAKMNSWINNSTTNGGSTINTTVRNDKSHPINSVYVINSVPITSSTLPAVRMVNGQQLPTAGLTVATALPLYVKGDYNITTNGTSFARTLGSTTNGNTVPAALMADAITVLSTNWSDTYSNGTSLGSRAQPPAMTTINAATMEGIVPSDGTHYSGGVENFLRLLEDWSSKTLTYNGSIVVMFKSQYATNFWQATGNYYNAPTRQWGFDVNFSKGENYLPPLSPRAQYVIRASWATIAPP